MSDNVISIDKAKKLEFPDPAKEGKTTKELGIPENVRKIWWEAVFWKLTEFPVFINFIDQRFTVGMRKMENGENPLDPIVIEKENKNTIALTADQIFKIGTTCLQSGARDSAVFTKRILSILGHKDNVILPANESEMQKAINQQDMKSKLDL